MREIREGEVPFAAGTAIQDDAERPAFRGNGPERLCLRGVRQRTCPGDAPEQMSKKVRVRCAVCSTVNVAVTEEPE